MRLKHHVACLAIDKGEARGPGAGAGGDRLAEFAHGRGGGGNDERAIALQTFFKQGGGGQQARQDARDLTGATARQQRDAVRAVPRERDGRRGACFGGAIDQWMPREACVERCLLEERGLKGQDAEQQIEYAREFRDAPATPGPDLRTDVVNRFDTAVVREGARRRFIPDSLP